MRRGRVEVLVCPFDAGNRDWRMGAGPEAVLAAGLVEALNREGFLTTSVDIEPPSDALPSELSTGFAVQREIVAATDAALGGGGFPVLLAGDCNASVGVIAGIQGRVADPAFVWCDAHADFHTPDSDAFGSLDSHGLAMLTGRAWTADASCWPTPPRGGRDHEPRSTHRMREGTARQSPGRGRSNHLAAPPSGRRDQRRDACA